MDPFIAQQILNWLVLSSIYALIALGFSLLFGVLDVIHFSHGDISMVAPFVALGSMQFLLATAVPVGSVAGLALACLIAIVVTGLFGIFIDWLVIQRFRHAPPMMVLVATVALGAVVRELIRTLYPQGSNPKAFPPLIDGSFAIGGVVITALGLFIVATAITLVLAVYMVIRYTPLGARIRAVAEDRDIARLMAIRPNRIFAATFFIATAVGAVGALFYVSYAGVVRFDFGIQLGLIGFSAAVIGGLGSMQGAVLGSLLIAGVETLVQATLAEGASYRLVFGFVLVIIVLVLKPSGILGKPVHVKV